MSVNVEIAEIKSTLNQILESHIGLKDGIECIRDKIDTIHGTINDKETESRERDTSIDQKCQSEFKSIYRAVAGFGAVSIVSIVGAIIAYLANK